LAVFNAFFAVLAALALLRARGERLLEAAKEGTAIAASSAAASPSFR
jgi:hypothetical protein